MKLLALATLLCALVPLISPHCYGKPETSGTHCQDYADKTWHAVGSSWRNSNCMDCTCSSCCSAYSIPTKFPPNCESVFDSEACEYIVRKKNDPSVRCPIYGAVGK
ncbi:beta-microseminoprotein-like isoform X2 [Plectropomus leopardus]|uniref:beta-microseminoprotein-like isoform X1 n=1 Tax=Plectropomus leopardus TaxID=160734 RepID=UPI001C4DB4EC|nr:beta-microseminoprotein-like isoform X1 [Plectropomus leopardus]XP_042344745.1 beta-microseminoprotein-like isoform X2 [Plectropomus leopardus]